MALIYRCVLEVPEAEPHHLLRSSFTEWLADRGPNSVTLELPESGELPGADLSKIRVSEAADDVCAVTRIELVENRIDDTMHTVATALSRGDERYIWIELERDATDAYSTRLDLRAPKLTTTILRMTPCRTGSMELHSEFQLVDAKFAPLLAELVHDSQRLIPLVVLTPLREDDADSYRRRAWETYVRCAGIAQVYVLSDGAAVDAFCGEVGDELQIYGGAIRCFLPIRRWEETRGGRHRYVRPERVRGSQPGDAAAEAVRSLVQRGTERSLPAIWADHGRALITRQGAHGRDSEELLEDLVSVEARLAAAEERIVKLEEARDFAYLEADEAGRERDEAHRLAKYLRRQVASLGEEPDQALEDEQIPESVADAVVRAKRDLKNLRVGADVEQGARELDQRSGQEAAASRAWQALRALDDYATYKQDGVANGNFIEYCKQPMGEAWSARHVSMVEGETVRNNPRMRAQRIFACDGDLDPEGKRFMEAHLQITRGGGDPARLYFHDDSAGSTGAIHIGYLGPHLTNSATN